MTTYQALLNKIKSFATAHQQIKRFGSDFNEQFDNFVNEGDSFPVLYVSSVDSLSQLNQITYTLEITCADLILEDRANVNVILNDCKLILNDLFIYYNSGNDNALHIEVEPTLTPLNNYSVDNLAGARMTVTFEVDTYGLCAIPIGEIEPTPSPDCEDANYTVRYESGTVIESGVIASGGSKTIQVPDCPAEPCDPVTYNITRDGQPFASGSEPSGGSINIDVPSDCPTPEPCEDATVNVNGTLFDTVESGNTLDIEVRKSTGNDLIGSKQGQYWRVGDSEVNVNSVKLTDVKATETLNITVVDSTDASVSVTLSGGNKITIPSLPCAAPPPCPETYKLSSWLVLTRNNPFGNTNRFTDTLGGTTYANDIVLDWLQADDVARTVRGYRKTLLTSDTLANQLAAEPYTVGSFTGFEIINADLLCYLVNKSSGGINNGLNYAPFNHVANSNGTRVRSKTDFHNVTTDCWVYTQAGNITAVVKTQSNQAIITRAFTYTELGL
jgi:hypothetical protein